MTTITRSALVLGGITILGSVGTWMNRGAGAAALKADSGPLVTIANPIPLPVQTTVPARPFYATASLPTVPGNSGSQILGPGSGKLAITSVLATNNSASPIGFGISNINFASGSAGSCTGTPNMDIAPTIHVIVPPNSTLSIPFPSPVVITPTATGQTCVDVITGNLLSPGALTVDITGFVN